MCRVIVSDVALLKLVKPIQVINFNFKVFSKKKFYFSGQHTVKLAKLILDLKFDFKLHFPKDFPNNIVEFAKPIHVFSL